MSTNVRTSSGEEGIIERNRERWFFLALIVGMLVFALGIAFMVLAFALNTHPPAPYFTTMTDRIMTGVISLAFLVGGALTVRLGAKIGGW